MVKQARLELSAMFFLLFFTACTVKSQTPEASIRVTSFNDEVAVTTELTSIALRNNLDFTTGTLKVNRGFLVNTIVKKDRCVVATATSSLSARVATVFFYRCEDFDYKILEKEFIDRAKNKGWSLSDEK